MMLRWIAVAWLSLAPSFVCAQGITFVESSSVFHDFVNDDAPGIQSALNAAGPGGWVVLSPSLPYWAKTAITIPKGVTLGCAAPPQKQLPVGSSYVSLGCAVYLAPNTPLTNNGSIINARVFQDNIHFAGQPTTSHGVKAITSNFASTGTGITNNGFDAIVRDVAIAGFNLCIDDQSVNRGALQNILMNCQNGVKVEAVGDYLKYSNLEVWPFYFTTLNGSSGQERQTITNVANNGSGAWRVTLSAAMPEALVNGDEVYIGGIVPLGIPQGAQGKHTVTVVSSTQYDLTGSRVAPTLTCTTTTGSPYCTGVNSFADWWPSMTFTGTCFSGTRTALMLLPGANALLADANATSTGSCTLTGASNAFAATGTPQLIYDPTDVHGIGFEFVGSGGGGIIGSNIYVWQKDTAIQFDANHFSTLLNQVTVDGDCTMLRSERIGYKFAANAINNLIGDSHNQTCGGFLVQNNSGGVQGQMNVLDLGRAVGWVWGAVEMDNHGIILRSLQDTDNFGVAGAYDGDVFSLNGSLLALVAGTHMPNGNFRSNLFSTLGTLGLLIDSGSLLGNLGTTLYGPLTIDPPWGAGNSDVTCNQTGGGTGASCIFEGLSSSSNGTAAILTGTTPSSSGTVVLTLTHAVNGGTATPSCTATYSV
jgi:hypothetical protein